MGTVELRKELHGYIDKADDRFLKMVHALAKSYEVEEEDYTLPGPPMDVETYRNRIKQASARVKAGEYITQEDLEKEMEQW
jgi:hypothetical protein